VLLNGALTNCLISQLNLAPHLRSMSPSPRTIIAFASAFYLLASTCKAVDFPENPALVSRLKTTNTYLDRMALFPNHTDWVYDFTTNPRYSWTPSSVCNANTATFPVLTDLGMTLAMLNLGPCSILPPHLHPRATNSVVAMAGSTNTYMIQENGARTVATNLTPGKMTVFPQGSLHTMQNIGEYLRFALKVGF